MPKWTNNCAEIEIAIEKNGLFIEISDEVENHYAQCNLSIEQAQELSAQLASFCKTGKWLNPWANET